MLPYTKFGNIYIVQQAFAKVNIFRLERIIMKTDKNILIAFILNFAFSVFEIIGGIFTGSTAIMSDAIHDLGDAASIGISWILEKKSKKAADEKFTYGYTRYSVVGGIITLLILVVGSVGVMLNAVIRIFEPRAINYSGMLIFAVVGVAVNLAAVIFTRNGGSLNQKAVNLHMLEDVLGWLIVLAGAVVMRFTDISVIDPLMSLGVAALILISSLPGLKEAMDILLDKAPAHIRIDELTEHLLEIEGVTDIHHLHIRSMDGSIVCATLHAVTSASGAEIKKLIKDELAEHGIIHATIELEAPDESCNDRHCCQKAVHISHGHCHGHGHSHA